VLLVAGCGKGERDPQFGVICRRFAQLVEQRRTVRHP
jgi:hypothetical protein